jgi:hypothetical protein
MVAKQGKIYSKEQNTILFLAFLLGKNTTRNIYVPAT